MSNAVIHDHQHTPAQLAQAARFANVKAGTRGVTSHLPAAPSTSRPVTKLLKPSVSLVDRIEGEIRAGHTMAEIARSAGVGLRELEQAVVRSALHPAGAPEISRATPTVHGSNTAAVRAALGAKTNTGRGLLGNVPNWARR